jgi:hypothetical protein
VVESSRLKPLPQNPIDWFQPPDDDCGATVIVV